MALKVITLAGLTRFKEKMDAAVAALLAGKVDKVDGKQLSTNDYTTAEKTKLAGIADKAQVNVLEKVSVDGKALPISNKGVDIDLSEFAKKADLTTVFNYKGTKATYAELPKTGNVTGDVWNVEAADPANKIDAGDNVVWDGTKWDVLGGTVDLSGYVQKEAGKGLSTNDFTDAEKTKLEGLKNYTHPTGDGNLHVPANGTSNGGKVLTATATAGVYEWKDIPAQCNEATTAEIDALFA